MVCEKNTLWLTFCALLLLATIFGCSSQEEVTFLDDRAGLLSQAERAHLVQYNAALLDDLDIHFKLIVLKEKADDINELAAELFGDLGKRTKGAKGLLFLVDPVNQQVRIEVGYDLEQVFPDIFIGYLERAQMIPFFEVGRVGHGIEAAMELLIDRMQRGVAGYAFDPDQEFPDLDFFSGGAGARSSAVIGAKTIGQQKERSAERDTFQPQGTPEETLQRYMQVLQNHVKDSQLPLFTPETRAFFSKWVVTDAQQDNELRSLRERTEGKVLRSGNYAVLRYPLKSRLQSPYFFRKGNDGWMLDFATMSRVLRMNHKNMWMMKSMEHPYMFAFADWSFDRNGFPVK